MTTITLPRAVVEQALEALESLFNWQVDPERGQRCGDAVVALRSALAQQAEPQGCATEEDCTKQPWCRIRGECQRKQAEPLNLSDRAVQRRLAAQWGYVPAAQAEPVEPVAREHMLAKHIEFQRAETQRYFELYNRACETARLRLQEIASLESRLAAQPVQEPAYKVEIAGRWHNAEPLPPAFSLPDGEHLLYTAPRKAEPVQEPAFHGFMSHDGTQVDVCFSPSAPRRDGTYATAYYTAPPQRKPLTDEEIVDAVREADLDWHSGWTLDEHEPNRFTTLVRAVEQAHGIKE